MKWAHRQNNARFCNKCKTSNGILHSRHNADSQERLVISTTGEISRTVANYNSSKPRSNSRDLFTLSVYIFKGVQAGFASLRCAAQTEFPFQCNCIPPNDIGAPSLRLAGFRNDARFCDGCKASNRNLYNRHRLGCRGWDHKSWTGAMIWFAGARF